MFNLQKRLEKLQESLSNSWQKLDIDAKFAKLQELDDELRVPETWRNADYARKLDVNCAKMHRELDDWRVLKTQASDMSELLDLNDESLVEELDAQLSSMEQKLTELIRAQRFTGKFDKNDAILRITAGAGGVDAMDWAEMLSRMYLRWGESHGVKVRILNIVAGEEAGVKTMILEMTGGDNLYGRLKSEHGVHRLVRLSPFNADHLRQTSFAQVEVLPIIPDDGEMVIDPKDLRIDVFHSGGHGGQSVNTTNSAVRITHLPTNTVVSIQDERSQQQNKEKAMEVLRGRLQRMMQDQNAESIDELRSGESASWGQQIRNYVLHPYKLVKDLRSGHQENDVDAVLDGDIDPFIFAFLDK